MEIILEQIKKTSTKTIKNILDAFVIYEYVNPKKGIEWEKNQTLLSNKEEIKIQKNRQKQEQTSTKGVEFLRLLVSEFNNPEIELYYKCKFNRVKGIHEERIRKDFSLNEYGFEIKLNETRDANS